MSDTTRDLLISLASHMAYMQGQLEARHELDDPEDYYWYRESVLLRQKVADHLAAEAQQPSSSLPELRSSPPTVMEAIELSEKAEAAGLGQVDFARAAELLQRQALVPVAVSERLPRPSVKVLAHYFNGLGKERTICAIWVPAKTRSDSYGDDDFTEYDEESDTFYWPEGWYETIENWDDLGYVKVDEGEVIYWQPIPKLSAHALPQPEVGE